MFSQSGMILPIWKALVIACGMEREQALVHTGRTATSLNMIFPLKATSIDYIPHHDVVATLFKGSEKFYEKQRKINNVRLQSLKGCIMRGHIAQGNNHFSIYLDLPRYLNNVLHNIRESDPESFSSWLTELHEKHFDPNAFNIIVSPLKKNWHILCKECNRSCV